jgi:hypothetical protein
MSRSRIATSVTDLCHCAVLPGEEADRYGARALEPAGCEERDLNNARACNSGIGHFWCFTGIVDGLLREVGGGVEATIEAARVEGSCAYQRWMGQQGDSNRAQTPSACLCLPPTISSWTASGEA